MWPWFTLYFFDIYDIILCSIDTCLLKLFVNHVTILRAQVYSSSRSCVLLKLTADKVLVFDWIAGSCQVKLLKTELGCSKASVNSNPGLKANQIITVSSKEFFLQLLFCVSVL